MNLKKEDFEIIRNFEDRLFLGLRLDFFDEEPLGEEEKEEIEAEPKTAPSDLETSPPPKTPRELALEKARAAKAAKKAELEKELEILKLEETIEELEKEEEAEIVENSLEGE